MLIRNDRDLPLPALIGVANDAFACDHPCARRWIHRPAMHALDPDLLQPAHTTVITQPNHAIGTLERSNRGYAETRCASMLIRSFGQLTRRYHPASSQLVKGRYDRAPASCGD